MQKKLMAVAVAGALAAPAAAFAQVEIYGRANLGLDQYSATGATAANSDYKSRMRVFDQGSRVGFRAGEDLGGGLRAIVNIETGVSIDSGSTLGQGGQANASGGTWASRDSFAGLQGNFGRLTFGRQSIFWSNGAINQFAANYVNQEVPWANGAGLRNGAGVSRQSNVMAYTTPPMGAMNATISYSPSGAETGASTGQENAGPGVKPDGNILGLTGRFTSAQVVGQFDYVINTRNSTLVAGNDVAGAKSTQWKLGGGFIYAPGALASLIYTSGETTAAGGGAKSSATAMTISWEHTFGNIMALAQYGTHSKTKTNGAEVAGTGAKAVMVGARFLMSKRTWTYVTYNATTNESAETRDYTGGSYTSANPINAGADPKIIAFGVFHSF